MTMQWVPETLVVGEESATEYSLCLPGRHLWLTVAPDGAVGFTSETATSLRTTFPNSPTAGTEDFAYDMLGWLRAEAKAPTGTTRLRAACTVEEAMEAQVFAFDGRRPLLHATGLEFNRDFNGKDREIFELRGPPALVDRWLADYLLEFPREDYNTRTAMQDCGTEAQKTMRVVRDRTFD